MFRITREPILSPDLDSPASGGFVSFEGRVRNLNEAQSVNQLEYEAFEPLAEQIGNQVLAEALAKFDIIEAIATHRIGLLEIGDVAVRVDVAAAHRGEAFDACEYIIDEIKRRLPIWKKEHYSSGHSDWVNCQVSTAPDNSEKAYYSRQLLLPQLGADGQEKLKQARVLVVGAGGLGAPALLYLAAAGVGTLDICEGDDLDMSNLHRQVLYSAGDTGRPKASLAAERLRDLNPFIEVCEFQERFSPNFDIEDYSVILDCTDNFSTKFLLNDLAVKRKKRLVQASIYQFEGQIHVYDPASDSPCLRCIWPVAPEDGCVGSCAEVGVLGVVPGFFGVIQATETIKLILGLGQPLAHQTLIVDLLNYSTAKLKRTKNPDCPICGKGTMKNIPTGFEIDSPDGLEDPIIVDLREPDERTPVPFSLPVIEIPFTTFGRRQSSLDPSITYVFVCSHGMRSGLAAREMRSKGFERAFSLRGGIG